MGKVDIIAKAKADLIAGQDAVLEQVIGAACDASALEQKASDGTLSQSDVQPMIDAAVEKALADAKVISDKALSDAQAVDAQALADEHAKMQAQVDDLTSKLADMTTKDQIAEKAVGSFQGALSALQASLDTLKSMVPKDVTPEPVTP
ncbi:MAG: hypothetical protein ACXVB1_00015 [Pseudobdellovibrionaceae bacterium]